MDNLVYMGNAMFPNVEHVWAPGEYWTFNKSDSAPSVNAVGYWESAKWKGRDIFRFVQTNVWD
jgi:hypothetical protein